MFVGLCVLRGGVSQANAEPAQLVLKPYYNPCIASVARVDMIHDAMRIMPFESCLCIRIRYTCNHIISVPTRVCRLGISVTFTLLV